MGLSKKSIFFPALLFLIFLSGCGLTGDLLDRDLLDGGGSSGLEQDAQEREKMLLELRKYMGKDANEIKKTFGKPADVESPSWYKKIKYEEGWHYKIEKGMPILFPHQFFIRFYFINDKVVEIEVN